MGKLSIKNLREISKEKDLQGIFAIAIRRNGTIDIVTYGENKKKCNALGWYAKDFDKNLSKIPFCTIFGWGRGGKENFDFITENEIKSLEVLGVPEYLWKKNGKD